MIDHGDCRSHMCPNILINDFTGILLSVQFTHSLFEGYPSFVNTRGHSRNNVFRGDPFGGTSLHYTLST